MDKKISERNNEIEIPFDNLEMFMSPRMVNGSPAIEVRRVITFCEKNIPILEKLIELGLSEKEEIIVTKVSLKFHDPYKALAQLQQLGLDTEKLVKKIETK